MSTNNQLVNLHHDDNAQASEQAPLANPLQMPLKQNENALTAALVEEYKQLQTKRTSSHYHQEVAVFAQTKLAAVIADCKNKLMEEPNEFDAYSTLHRALEDIDNIGTDLYSTLKTAETSLMNETSSKKKKKKKKKLKAQKTSDGIIRCLQQLVDINYCRAMCSSIQVNWIFYKTQKHEGDLALILETVTICIQHFQKMLNHYSTLLVNMRYYNIPLANLSSLESIHNLIRDTVRPVLLILHTTERVNDNTAKKIKQLCQSACQTIASFPKPPFIAGAEKLYTKQCHTLMEMIESLCPGMKTYQPAIPLIQNNVTYQPVSANSSDPELVHDQSFLEPLVDNAEMLEYIFVIIEGMLSAHEATWRSLEKLLESDKAMDSYLKKTHEMSGKQSNVAENVNIIFYNPITMAHYHYGSYAKHLENLKSAGIAVYNAIYSLMNASSEDWNEVKALIQRAKEKLKKCRLEPNFSVMLCCKLALACMQAGTNREYFTFAVDVLIEALFPCYRVNCTPQVNFTKIALDNIRADLKTILNLCKNRLSTGEIKFLTKMEERVIAKIEKHLAPGGIFAKESSELESSCRQEEAAKHVNNQRALQQIEQSNHELRRLLKTQNNFTQDDISSSRKKLLSMMQTALASCTFDISVATNNASSLEQQRDLHSHALTVLAELWVTHFELTKKQNRSVTDANSLLITMAFSMRNYLTAMVNLAQHKQEQGSTVDNELLKNAARHLSTFIIECHNNARSELQLKDPSNILSQIDLVYSEYQKCISYADTFSDPNQAKMFFSSSKKSLNQIHFKIITARNKTLLTMTHESIASMQQYFGDLIREVSACRNTPSQENIEHFIQVASNLIETTTPCVENYTTLCANNMLTTHNIRGEISRLTDTITVVQKVSHIIGQIREQYKDVLNSEQSEKLFSIECPVQAYLHGANFVAVLMEQQYIKSQSKHYANGTDEEKQNLLHSVIAMSKFYINTCVRLKYTLDQRALPFYSSTAPDTIISTVGLLHMSIFIELTKMLQRTPELDALATEMLQQLLTIKITLQEIHDHPNLELQEKQDFENLMKKIDITQRRHPHFVKPIKAFRKATTDPSDTRSCLMLEIDSAHMQLSNTADNRYFLSNLQSTQRGVDNLHRLIENISELATKQSQQLQQKTLKNMYEQLEDFAACIQHNHDIPVTPVIVAHPKQRIFFMADYYEQYYYGACALLSLTKGMLAFHWRQCPPSNTTTTSSTDFTVGEPLVLFDKALAYCDKLTYDPYPKLFVLAKVINTLSLHPQPYRHIQTLQKALQTLHHEVCIAGVNVHFVLENNMISLLLSAIDSAIQIFEAYEKNRADVGDKVIDTELIKRNAIDLASKFFGDHQSALLQRSSLLKSAVSPSNKIQSPSQLSTLAEGQFGSSTDTTIPLSASIGTNIASLMQGIEQCMLYAVSNNNLTTTDNTSSLTEQLKQYVRKLSSACNAFFALLPTTNLIAPVDRIWCGFKKLLAELNKLEEQIKSSFAVNPPQLTSLLNQCKVYAQLILVECLYNKVFLQKKSEASPKNINAAAIDFFQQMGSLTKIIIELFAQTNTDETNKSLNIISKIIKKNTDKIMIEVVGLFQDSHMATSWQQVRPTVGEQLRHISELTEQALTNCEPSSAGYDLFSFLRKNATVLIPYINKTKTPIILEHDIHDFDVSDDDLKRWKSIDSAAVILYKKMSLALNELWSRFTSIKQKVSHRERQQYESIVGKYITLLDEWDKEIDAHYDSPASPYKIIYFLDAQEGQSLTGFHLLIHIFNTLELTLDFCKSFVALENNRSIGKITFRDLDEQCAINTKHKNRQQLLMVFKIYLLCEANPTISRQQYVSKKLLSYFNELVTYCCDTTPQPTDNFIELLCRRYALISRNVLSASKNLPATSSEQDIADLLEQLERKLFPKAEAESNLKDLMTLVQADESRRKKKAKVKAKRDKNRAAQLQRAHTKAPPQIKQQEVTTTQPKSEPLPEVTCRQRSWSSPPVAECDFFYFEERNHTFASVKMDRCLPTYRNTHSSLLFNQMQRKYPQHRKNLYTANADTAIATMLSGA